MNRTVLRLLALAMPLALAGCDDGVSPPVLRVDEVAGSYIATRPPGGTLSLGALTFTIVQNGVERDLLAEGSEIDLLLGADGTTTGHVFVAGAEEEGDLEADLTGTWSLDGTVVTLDHEADTFLRDMPLTVRGDRLEGEETFAGVRVRVVLEQPEL
jgi:hypothetical protein